MKCLAFGTLSFVLITGALSAQETQRFTASIGAGFTTPVGRAGQNLDTGWNVQGGVGVNFIPYLGLNLDLGYNQLGVTSSVLNNLGYGGGGMHIFSATLDPIVHVNPHGHVDVYLTGGGGLYHRNQDFTQPSVAVVNGYNPFFGFYQVAVPAQQVVASYSVNKPGIDAGVGIAFGTRWHGKIFAEARWNRIFNQYTHTDYVPVTFGYRW